MSYPPNNQLTEEQRNFIPHVLEHVFPERAAKAVGIEATTALKWMQSAAFRAELDKQRKLSAINVMHFLERYANKAVIALVDMLSESNNNDGLRIKAADAILSHTIEFRKLYGIETRLEALEEVSAQAKDIKARQQLAKTL